MSVAVRIGLHTGEPVAVGDGYVGLDVHRAARICGAAHGGQVLVSAETARLLCGAAPEGIGLRDLGQHAVRDLAQPEHLFQLNIAGLPDEFPPPRREHRPAAAVLPSPERSILVVSNGHGAPASLVEIAEPLARSHITHELIVARLFRLTGGEGRPFALARATAELHDLRASLPQRGVAGRVAAFTSAAPGEDIVKLALEQAVDLVLLERFPEQLREDEFDPDLLVVLATAPCDVAVCLLREGHGQVGENPVLVRFGGGRARLGSARAGRVACELERRAAGPAGRLRRPGGG
jgi:hypothetical protein